MPTNSAPNSEKQKPGLPLNVAAGVGGGATWDSRNGAAILAGLFIERTGYEATFRATQTH